MSELSKKTDAGTVVVGILLLVLLVWIIGEVSSCGGDIYVGAPIDPTGSGSSGVAYVQQTAGVSQSGIDTDSCQRSHRHGTYYWECFKPARAGAAKGVWVCVGAPPSGLTVVGRRHGNHHLKHPCRRYF